MATIEPTRLIVSGGRGLVYTWQLADGDDGAPIDVVEFADRSVQVTGTFGGGNVRVEGSNDSGANYAVLTDTQGNDLNLGAAKIEMVTEVTQLLRPRVTAGSGVAVTVSLLARYTA